MSKTQPWSVHKGDGVPIWDLMAEDEAVGAREYFAVRSSHLQYGDGYSREVADIFAYALLVDKLWDRGDVITQEMIDKSNVIVQVDRASRIRHHWEFGRTLK